MYSQSQPLQTIPIYRLLTSAMQTPPPQLDGTRIAIHPVIQVTFHGTTQIN
jgi:hypothetical protein